MSIGIDILSQFPNAVQKLLDIYHEPERERRVKRIDFRDHELGPLHRQMVEIHDDYVRSFRELARLLKAHEQLDRIVEILEDDRVGLQRERRDVLAFSAEIAAVRNDARFVNPDVAALVRYGEGIESYFQAANPNVSAPSWYSEFIRYCRSHRRDPESVFAPRLPTIESGDHPAHIVAAAYQNAVHEYLPAAWQVYSASYQGLRLVLGR
jgi:hypothetical protein